MFEPKNFRRDMAQAMNSVRWLKAERDLHQAALSQWIGGNFTLIDNRKLKRPPVQDEYWLCLTGVPETDMLVRVLRYPDTAVIQAMSAEKFIQEAAQMDRDSRDVKIAYRILEMQDRLSRSGQQKRGEA